MSSREEVRTKDTVEVKLYGPDGELKDSRSSEKPSIITIIIAMLLLIPYLIYKTLVPSNK